MCGIVIRRTTAVALAAALLAAPGPLAGQGAAPRSEAFLKQVSDAQRDGTLRLLDFLQPGDVTGELDLAVGFTGPGGARALLEGLLGIQRWGNTAVVEQEGDSNAASVTQRGRRNVAAVLQQGSGNRLGVLQDGDANLFGASFLGSNNTFGLTQSGNDNAYILSFIGDGLDHRVIQHGSGLRALQFGVGTLPFGIVQQGDQMEITIEHNPGTR